MRSSNPVFKRGYAAMDVRDLDSRTEVDALEEQFAAPAASSIRTGRVTMEDIVTRTGVLFGILLISGAFAWYANLEGGALLLGFGGGFILAMVISFSKKVRPALIMLYAALQGLALGVISHIYEVQMPGIVSQAVIGTLSAFVGALYAYRSGKIRVTPRFTRILVTALIGYLVLALVNIVAVFVFNATSIYSQGLLSIGIASLGVALASFFLILDFDQASKMVAAGAPEVESWRAGFGLMVTIVWLYLEVLRLIAILRRD
jgi:uncharacterized YccA/Bax inhibitor family protein